MNKSYLEKLRFNELYTMSSGISSTKEQAGHGYPFVSFSTIFNNFFLPEQLPDLMDTSDKDRENCSVLEGDVFLTRTSETPDELAMSCVSLKNYTNATFSGFAKRLRPINKGLTYPKYMAFYLRSPYFRKVINNNTIMTLRASFNEDMFSFLNLYLPKYEEQVKIGDLLYLIEKKIQLNEQINNNLEQQAMSLYDYWFTQYNFPDIDSKPYKLNGGILIYNNILKRNIPKDWIVAPISEHTNIYQPQTISNELFNETYNYEVYGGGGLIGRYFEYNHKESEVIISCRGNCGNFYFTSPKSWITGNAMVVNPKDKNLSKYYLYHYFMRYGVKQYLSGSVQKQLTRENLSIMNIVIPPKNILEAFDKIIKPIFDEILNHKLEITKLNRLKNWLLPLLMNGQATIKE